MKGITYKGDQLKYSVPFEKWDYREEGDEPFDCFEYMNSAFDKIIKTTYTYEDKVIFECYRNGELRFTENHTKEEDQYYKVITFVEAEFPDNPVGEYLEIVSNKMNDNNEWAEALIATNVIYPLIIFGNYEFKTFDDITSFKDLALRWAQKGYYDNAMLQTCVTKNKLTIDEYNEIINAINNA